MSKEDEEASGRKMSPEDRAAADITQLRELLEAKLLPEDAAEFEDDDLRLLVQKRYRNERTLKQATIAKLQGPPGPALAPYLIDALLAVFNPPKASEGTVKHASSVRSTSCTTVVLFSSEKCRMFVRTRQYPCGPAVAT